jgi:K+-transporting ATPase KdpF subunit
VSASFALPICGIALRGKTPPSERAIFTFALRRGACFLVDPLFCFAPFSLRQAVKERSHVGCDFPRRRLWPDRRDGALRPSPDPRVREAAMFEPIAGLIVALGLGAYLVVALLMPERF